MTSLGIPMVWMGEEIGVSAADAWPRVMRCSIDMQVQGENTGCGEGRLVVIASRGNVNHLNKSMLEFYRGIVNLHRDNKALRSNNLNFIHEDHENHVLVYHRW